MGGGEKNGQENRWDDPSEKSDGKRREKEILFDLLLFDIFSSIKLI